MIAILYDDLTYRQIFLDGRALETDPSAFAQPCGSEVQSGPRCRIQGSHIVANQRTGLFRAVIANNKPGQPLEACSVSTRQDITPQRFPRAVEGLAWGATDSIGITPISRPAGQSPPSAADSCLCRTIVFLSRVNSLRVPSDNVCSERIMERR